MAKSNEKSVAWLSSDARAPILIDATVCLGRSINCDVVLSDPDVSRRHAAVHPADDNEYWISDLGGRHGVFVNDVRIHRSARLQHGDLIRIVRHTFRFLRSDGSSFSTREDGSVEFALSDGSVEERWLMVADIQEGVRWGAKQGAVPYHKQLDQWYRQCRGVVENHQGRVNKFMGNGFLATWAQNPEVVEHVHRALKELHELQRTGDVPFRIAVHLGEVTVSSVGSVGGESLLGPQLNYVFRMEKAAAVNGYSNLISPSAGQRLSTLMTLESVANLDDPIFGAGQSLLTVPGNRDRGVPLSDSDGDATAQAAIWSDIDPD
jgi:class 3 adenylate cyclase